MGKYACVRTDNMSGTVVGKDLVSLKYAGDIENGCILKVGAFEEGEREVRTATLAANSDEIRDLALVATPEVVVDKKNAGLSDFINKEGAIIRGYRLASGDMFSVTKAAFDPESEGYQVGKKVEVGANGKLKALASPVSKTLGQIVLVEGEWFVIEVA